MINGESGSGKSALMRHHFKGDLNTRARILIKFDSKWKDIEEDSSSTSRLKYAKVMKRLLQLKKPEQSDDQKCRCELFEIFIRFMKYYVVIVMRQQWRNLTISSWIQ